MNWKEVSKKEYNELIQKLLHHPESKEKMREYVEWEYNKVTIDWDFVTIAGSWDICRGRDGREYYINLDMKGLI